MASPTLPNPAAANAVSQLPTPTQFAAQTAAQNAAPPADLETPINLPQSTPSFPRTTPPTVQGPTGWHRVIGNIHDVLMGNHTEYVPSDPTNPNSPPVPRSVPNKPGQLFRSILAGAMMGAAASTDSKSGAEAFSKGFGAERQDLAQQKALQAKQAQQQWQNQLSAKREQREEDTAKQEKLKTDAQIGMWNIEKLKYLNELHGKSYTDHRQMVKDASPIVEGYKALGNDPTAQNVPETEHTKWLQEHPGDSTVDWEPVDVIPYAVKNPDGTDGIDYQTVWNKYSKTKDMIITPDLMKRMKDSGVLDSYPEGALDKTLKTDTKTGQKSLPYDQFVGLMTKVQNAETDKYNRQVKTDALAKNQKELKELDARINQANAAARASGDESALRRLEADQIKSANSAQAKLAKAGGDWEKAGLTPAEIVAVQPKVEKDIADARAVLNDRDLVAIIKDADKNSPEYKQAVSTWTDARKKLDDAESHSVFHRFGSSSGSDDPAVSTAISRLKGLPADQVETTLSAYPITPEQKSAIRKGLNIPEPTPQYPSDKVTVQRGDGSTVQTTRSSLEQWKKDHPQDAPYLKVVATETVPTKTEQQKAEEGMASIPAFY